MAEYKAYVRMTDTGPYIIKLVLDLGCEVGANDISPAMFNVHCTRREGNGAVVLHKDWRTKTSTPSAGYLAVVHAYPCDEQGNRRVRGRFAALEVEEQPLGKCIEGDVMASRYVENSFCITQLAPLPGMQESEAPVTGLVFDTCTDTINPALSGWQNGENTLRYGWFTPQNEGKEKLPLVLWLHGAGEGGEDTTIAYTGNKVTALSCHDIQTKLGGAAWVLVPQCPTVWMNNGKETLGRSNESIYTVPLKACLDAFIAMHREEINTDRIYISGISNGGFMTLRMLADYPGFFAAAMPGCAAFYAENVSDAMLADISRTPIWFVHAKKDELVNPRETTLPLYKRLKATGTKNVHFTLWDDMVDLTGQYRDELGRPQPQFNHSVWVPMLNDACRLDLDGTRVMEDGEPVTMWEWAANQSTTSV